MHKRLKINFIGNFGSTMTSEIADETHLAANLGQNGDLVTKVPRDVWKAFVDGHAPNDDWVLPNEDADINIICKWAHFNDGRYVRKLRELTGAPAFYWTWDFMGWPNPPEFHRRMAEAADLHLTNEGDHEMVQKMLQWDIKHYYFPFDVTEEHNGWKQSQYKNDVAFFGSYFDAGVRKEYLKEVDKKYDLQIYSENYNQWNQFGLSGNKPVYGDELFKKIAESKIVLSFSVNDDCWGYWSNRIGKVLVAGGFLLARYTPGMELFLSNGAVYFKSKDEMMEKIEYYLNNGAERKLIRDRGAEIGRLRFTSSARTADLLVLIERFLKGDL